LHPKILLNIEVASFKEPPIEDYDLTLLPTEAGFDADVIARKISSTEAVLVASPAYIQRRDVPVTPQDLIHHEVLRLKGPRLRPRSWRLFNSAREDEVQDVVVEPGLWINHTDTLLRAALGGAGITSIAVDLAAPYFVAWRADTCLAAMDHGATDAVRGAAQSAVFAGAHARLSGIHDRADTQRKPQCSAGL
jgi:DNA-binding transcriptional LysR family regulator